MVGVSWFLVGKIEGDLELVQKIVSGLCFHRSTYDPPGIEN